MCLAIPGQVIKIEGRQAQVKYGNDVRKALVGEDNIKVGDFVMVQMGIIIKIVNETEAKASLKAWGIKNSH